jgi:hypothetical protein
LETQNGNGGKMSEPATIPQKKAISLKLPKNPKTAASILLITLSPRESLIDQDLSTNAKLLFSVLITSIDLGVLIELKKELIKRFPENQNGL